MNNYCIYMHRNKINDMKYIGQTCRVPEERWGRYGKGYYQSPVFFYAILQYGWDNFDHIILETGLTAEQANEQEEYYIDLYDTTNIKKGYNIKGGYIEEDSFEGYNTYASDGKSNVGFYYLCENTGEVFRTTIKAAEYGGIKSGSSISAVCRGVQKHAGKHPDTGERLSWSYCDKDGNKIDKGTKSPRALRRIEASRTGKKVRCLETGEIFESCVAAAEYGGLKAGIGSPVSNQIAGRTTYSGNHPETGIKLHWEYVEDA